MKNCSNENCEKLQHNLSAELLYANIGSIITIIIERGVCKTPEMQPVDMNICVYSQTVDRHIDDDEHDDDDDG